MDSQITNLPVNWVDGMKINKSHFIATDRYIAGAVKDAGLLSLTPFNYGLLLQKPGNGSPVNVSVETDNQGFVHARVVKCQAITRGGLKIDIGNNYFSDESLAAGFPEIKFDTAQPPRNLYVALSVNPLGRVPFGSPDPEENPPRLPYVIPEYRLSVHTSEEKNNAGNENVLFIAKIIFIDGKPEIDTSFIPACQAVYSHPSLADYHAQLLRFYAQLEIDLADILKGIREKKQNTTIAATVDEISDALLLHLSMFMSEFRRMAKYYPPVFIFESLATLARIIKNITDIQPAAEREEFINYIMDWTSLKQGEFETLIKQAADFEYDHDDIGDSIQKIEPFVRMVAKLFNTLSNLDFIGKKKDRHIFVKEQKEKPSSSFLVD